MKISIDGWETGLRFVAGHFLPSIEKCSRLHGHNYALSIMVEGEPGDGGIVVDFIELKRLAHTLIERIDHRMLLPTAGKSMKITIEGEQYIISFNGKRYVIPQSDVATMPLENISAEELSRYFAQELARGLRAFSNISAVTATISEGKGQEASWEERLR
ncbi:MAG: 6-pyruvoyl tetrahydropterin synthase family protein [Candidatus Thermoplasmatota archaeon]|uniref:6-pyruvoyl tetrahydropterin synthase family protein n=1 Tax=Candidatus Sysuiplasma superficiale TaxID=2823368 RepID=A0A8J8CB71_9ARCH|nr:6-pyruvoyl tetrahydropterin synthase family protein [Candidatus Sysuiplasma superficiale]MCL4347212.1 6-pyruvoyl tetrahydropterin synthase family protein [Candidatus Thermoplasmatota archaeon]